jgi:hypothetical protein
VPIEKENPLGTRFVFSTFHANPHLIKKLSKRKKKEKKTCAPRRAVR